jgi:site-specific recombinase XerD
LLRAFLNGRKAETITAYRQDLEDFQAFIQAPSLEQAASLLLARGSGEANALALEYKAHLMDRELAANTINRRSFSSSTATTANYLAFTVPANTPYRYPIRSSARVLW